MAGVAPIGVVKVLAIRGVPGDRSVQCLGDVPAPATVAANDNCGGAIPMTKTSWYADGVGLVKSATEGGQIKYGSELVDYSFKKKPQK